MNSLSLLTTENAFDRLCELNVIEQARHVCETTAVRDAWARGRNVTVHGLIYGLKDGRLSDLGFVANDPQDVETAYLRSVSHV